MPVDAVTLSCLDNFFRLFLALPPSEVRWAATDSIGLEDVDASDSDAAPSTDGRRYPNGLLVVDGGGTLLRRIAKLVKEAIAVHSPNQQRPSEHRNVKHWLRIISSMKPIPTVWKVSAVSASEEDPDAASESDTTRQLVDSLGGHCDAVIAFEGDVAKYRLRTGEYAATTCTSLARSCELVLQQEELQETWHWDRDAVAHCRWLGLDPPDVERRNRRMIGAALAFESSVKLYDRHFGSSLCTNVLRRPDEYKSWRRNENDVFQKRWAPKWLESVKLMLDAWRIAASEVGNTQARSLVIWTAVDASQWNELGWHFIAVAERFLSEALEGEVEIKVCSNPLKETPAGRKADQEMHPRYLVASTRAIQIDRGFDVAQISRDDDLEHMYTEVTSRSLSAARYVHERWTEKGMTVLPRIPNPPLKWMRSMTKW